MFSLLTAQFKRKKPAEAKPDIASASMSPVSSSESSSSDLNSTYPNLPKKYRLIEVLGEGAFSIVYKALNTETRQTVAIKIIDKYNLNNKQLQNVMNEINIMRNISHPNILKLYDYYNYSNYCYLVVEYCDGGEIFNKIIEFTYFSEQLSRHVFGQLLDAVRHMHSHGIVHRDIKPENLFFCTIPMNPRPHDQFQENLRQSDDGNKVDEGDFVPGQGGGGIGTIKLGDFGLAKKLSKSTKAHMNLKTPCGTAGYTAPEVISISADIDKQNYYSKQVDIWSLGCFLYTILCGFPPFYDDDSQKLTMKILNGNYTFLKPWWDEVSIEAKDLVTKMLVINPNERITLDEIFNHAWIKGETFSDDYFNINSKYENENVEHVEHVEHVDDSESIDSNAPIKKTPQPSPFRHEVSASFPTDLKAPKDTDPLFSPRATAIKSVFNNPAMNDLSNLKFNNGAIFDIVEEEKDVLTSLQDLVIRSSSEVSEVDSSNDNDVETYQTRQSSIASTNDKFQLNLNDSNLLLRRKSTATKRGSDPEARTNQV